MLTAKSIPLRRLRAFDAYDPSPMTESRRVRTFATFDPACYIVAFGAFVALGSSVTFGAFGGFDSCQGQLRTMRQRDVPHARRVALPLLWFQD
jgi:hypothetical protein